MATKSGKPPKNAKDKPEKPKSKGGRPSKFDETIIVQAKKLALKGWTDEEMAEFWGVHPDTVAEWKNKHVEFSEALKEGKKVPDNAVEQSLFQRALGYSHPAVKIFCDKFGEVIEAPYTEHYPPDTTACIFWLKNRRKDKWRDKQEHELSGKDGAPLQAVINIGTKPKE